MEEKKNGDVVRAVTRAFDIIELLAKNETEMSVTEIAEQMGLSASTVFRQLTTLKERGYIFQNEANSKYWLGMRFYMLGNMVKHHLPLVNIMSDALDEVGRKYKQTVYIVVPDYSSDMMAQQAIIYKKSFTPIIFKNEAMVGTVSPSNGAASGKCMMAYYPDSLMKEYHQYPLPRLTRGTIADWEAMDNELALIRSRGYALDSEEEEEGKTCIAVPILDSYKNVIGSVSISGTTQSLFQNPINAIVKDLNEIVNLVAAEI